jgi:Nif-specific regulatory protein
MATDGPLRGRTVQLTMDELSIGRKSSNALPIADTSVSRHHCTIRALGGQYTIYDLDSQNGTIVNGVPARERVLAHGDEIVIGNSHFRFLTAEAETPTGSTPQFEDREVNSDSTILLRRENAVYAQTDQLRRALPPVSNVVRDLSVLLEINRIAQTSQTRDALGMGVLERTLERIVADRGAVVLVDSRTKDVSSVLARSKQAGSIKPFPVSRNILERVTRENLGVLVQRAHHAAPFPTESLVRAGTRSLLAAPLIGSEGALGMICLESSSPGVQFEEDHLQLLTGIAAIAGAALEKLIRIEWLETERRRLEQEIHIAHDMVGESPRMRQVYQRIEKLAPLDATVLIMGESGTGKELAARALHRNSPRSGRPFVAINCATLTESLLESELFGYEKGAFTGAFAQKKGKLELAEGGSVFLDEVGELSPVLQAKLLRVLQERVFERVGGTRTIPLDVRIIAATNRDLKKSSETGGFRSDLYFRLNVVSFEMPALRERREDIPLLATYFVIKHRERIKRYVAGLSPEARAAMMAYDWPGNVRELANSIERAVALGSTDVILPEDLPESILDTMPAAEGVVSSYHEGVHQAKTALIVSALERANGNYTQAAKLLGINPTYLHRLIRTMNLKMERAARSQ